MRKFSSILIAAVMLALGLSVGLGVGRLSAGSPDSPGGPTSPAAQMHTLEQIYQRLSSGAAATQMTTFTEPSTAPGTGTMHTLNDIWAVAYPGAFAIRVAQTGQTQCWDTSGTLISCASTGQDGQYQLGITPAVTPTNGTTTGAYNTPSWTGTRFTDNGNGTVMDNLTALIWLKNANCVPAQHWASALAVAAILASGSCGLTDGSTAGQWRLPNVNELHSLIDLIWSSPALPAGHPFTNVQSAFYWSSTSWFNPSSAWFVSLNSGYVNGAVKSGNALFVWPVRGGQ